MLVVHEWWGHNEHARNQASRLAKAGYVGFALDMYGKGKLATHPADAQAVHGRGHEGPGRSSKARFEAALAVLKQDSARGPRAHRGDRLLLRRRHRAGMARQGVDLTRS